MHELSFFQQLIEQEILRLNFPQQPADLYDPVRYMLKLGGKRIRPALVLMSCEMFDVKYENTLPAALGIEVFHNFTLLHDDIMDKAPLRRSQQTVHKKWNADVAILSGDVMFVKAVQLLSDTKIENIKLLMDEFLKTAQLVCEGQQWDMTFQNTDDVTISQYLKMIELKTAVLLACSLKTGAMIAGASEQDQNLIYEFGKNLGIAFQLHDDILDLYGGEKFGKQKGGDIIANKKTFLLLKAREVAGETLRAELNRLLDIKKPPTENSEQRIAAVKDIFEKLSVKSLAEVEMNRFFNTAIANLNKIQLPSEKKSLLQNLATTLMNRSN